MSNLSKIEQQLKARRPASLFLKIKDTNSGNLLESPSRNDVNEKGGLKPYLKWLHENHAVHQITISPRFSNGNRDISAGDDVTLNIGSPMTTTTPAVSQPTPPPQMPGLMGAHTQVPGVGLNQIMEGYTAQQMLQVLRQEHATLRSKYEAVKAEKEKV